MAGDYTRTTFRPSEDHSSVLMQQGRVMLDADWNEQVQLLDRRLRAEVVDMLARCVTSLQTPDAFLIALAGGKLTIGRGRAYVDGVLAENHGTGPFVYDPVLGELTGTQPLDYGEQPYFPNSATIAPLPTSGTYVAYLDVWEREVTYLEDPDLVEKAIAVDTATRLQNAWQVRLLAAPDAATCDSDVPGWDALTAPSAGRLSTAAVGVPASTDPCTIPPYGGYRGTENRLYRVEIHDKGPLGTATFKWSHDNASIASHVRTIDASATELTVDRLGRDGVKRIGGGDWVEITDDWLELNGLPGEMRKVAAVDEVRQALTLSTPLTTGTFDATDPTRHTRVIRWDQKGPAVDAAGGLLAVPAGGPASPIVLDQDGVQITFDTDVGGDFHTGDYWIFAARTADASVEALVEEPPRGIEHHYCRLAVVTFPDTVTDCRQRPPDGDRGCDCTVCVTPQSHATGTLTIQQAIDMVKVPGGKVCLQPGIYRLRETVRIQRAGSIQLQGKGWKTILIGPPRAPAIEVESSVGVIIDLLTIVTSTLAKRTATPMGIAILLHNTIGTVIERCVMLQLGQLQQPPPPPTGGQPHPPPDPCPPENLRMLSTKGEIVDLRGLFGPKGAGGALIALDGIVIETLIDQNVLIGTTGVGPVWADLGTSVGALKSMDVGFATAAGAERSEYLMTFDLAIEENLFVCWLTGISLEGFSLQLSETRIARNSLLACVRAAIVTTGFAAPGARIQVTQNLARVTGYGIVAGTDDTRIIDNDVALLRGLGTISREGSLVSLSASLGESTGVAARYLALLGGDAIVLAPSLRPATIARCQVRGNRATDVVGNGIAIRTPVGSAMIADNTVEAVGGGGVIMDGRATAQVLGVERNQLRRIGLLQDQRTQFAVGILLAHSRDVAVQDNHVEAVGLSSEEAIARFGIGLVRCQSIRVGGNTVADVAPAEFLGLSAGIAVLDRFQRTDVLDNGVRRAEAPGKPVGEWFGILIAGAELETMPSLGSFTVEGTSNVYTLLPVDGRIISFPRARDSLAVRGNVVEAFGRVPAVQIATDAPCLFGENRCFLTAVEGVPAARITAAAALASNNYLQASLKTPALEIQLPAGAPFTVLGNVASGPIEVDGAALPAPWQPLNTY
jgi:hypothetical protein